MSVRRRAASVLALVALAVAPASAFAGGRGHDDPGAHRSLRQAVTDQNFYFVMADRSWGWTALFLKLGVSQIAVVPRPLM